MSDHVIPTVHRSSLQARIDQVEHEIKDIQHKKEDEENEIDGTGSGSASDEDDDDEDKYDQTYEEKVKKTRMKSLITTLRRDPQTKIQLYFIGSPRRHRCPHQPHLIL